MKHKSILVFIITIMLLNTTLSAQNIEFIYPVNGQEDVSISPDITITTDLPVDESSLKMTWQEFVIDTTATPPDTTYELLPNYPTIYVIDSYVYENLPDSVWQYNTKAVSAEIINDTTIKVHTRNLDNFENHFIFIQNLRVVDGQDTLTCSNTNITFKTQKADFALLESSLGQGFLRTNDTLYFDFNRAIDSVTTALGDMVNILNVHSSIQVDSTTYRDSLVQINCDLWFNIDSTRIFVKPNGLELGDDYYAQVNLDYLTGDTLDKSYHWFHVAEYFKLKLTATPDNYIFHGFSDSLKTCKIGDSIFIKADYEINGKTFSHWSCPKIPQLDGSTDMSIAIPSSLENIPDIDIIAVYETPPTRNITVIQASNCTISVYDMENSYLGGAGNYIVRDDGKEHLRIICEPSQPYQFTHWSCPEVDRYNNYPVNDITVSGKYGNLTLSPNLIPPNTSGEMTLDILVRFSWDGITSRSDQTHKIEDFINISPAANHFDTENGLWMLSRQIFQVPTTVNFDLSINQQQCDCYRIYSIQGDYLPSFIDDFNDGGPTKTNISTYPITIDASNPNQTIVVEIDRRLVDVYASLSMENSVDMPEKSEAKLEITPNYKTYTSNDILPEGRIKSYSRDNDKEIYELSVKCGADIEVNVHCNDNFEFLHYLDNSYFDEGSTPTHPKYIINNITESHDINNGKAIGGVMKDEFRILKIGVCSEPGTDEMTYSTPLVFKNRFGFKSSSRKDPDVCYFPYNEETLVFELLFNKPVDIDAFNDLPLGHFYVEEISPPLNLPVNRPYSNSPIRYYPDRISDQWISNKRLRFICDAAHPLGMAMKKMFKYQAFKIFISEAIKDLNGDNLNNVYEFNGLTEYPTVKIYSEEIIIEPEFENQEPESGLSLWEFFGLFGSINTYPILENEEIEIIDEFSAMFDPELDYYKIAEYPNDNVYEQTGQLMTQFEITSFKNASYFDNEIALFYFEEDGEAKQEISELFDIFEQAFEKTHFKYTINKKTLLKDVYRIIQGEGFGLHLVGKSNNEPIRLNFGNHWGTSYSETEETIDLINENTGITVQYKVVIE